MGTSRTRYHWVAAVLGICAICGTARSASGPVTHTAESEAVATFDSFDSTGTIETNVVLLSFNYVSAQRGQKPVKQAQTGLSIFIFDHAVNKVLLNSQGATDQQELMVDPTLKTAHLRCTCELTDGTQSTFNANVDVTWKIPPRNAADVETTVDKSVPGTVTTSSIREVPAKGVIGFSKSTEYPGTVKNAIPDPALLGDDQTELLSFTQISN